MEVDASLCVPMQSDHDSGFIFRRLRGDLTRLGRGVHPLRSVGFLLFDSLLDSSIDLTGDGDAGVLLDPIIFGPFSQSYAALFNKTSRLRCLDGFTHENLEMYIIHSLPRPLYSYSMRMCISCF